MEQNTESWYKDKLLKAKEVLTYLKEAIKVINKEKCN